MQTDTEIRRPSKRDPEASRQALIDATLDTIADIGLTDTTVSHIIKRANLSRGMIHLHFDGKENLLTAAAKYFNEKYYEAMTRQLQSADAGPEEVVMAVIRADLSKELLNERSSKIWHAFRGAAPSLPEVAKFSSTQDEQINNFLLQAFTEISADTHPNDHSIIRQATFGTLALLEGMWAHYRSDMDGFSRDEAITLIRRFLAGLFPGHFIDDPDNT